MKPIAGCLACLLAGVAIGWLLPRSGKEATQPQKSVSTTKSPQRARAAESRTNHLGSDPAGDATTPASVTNPNVQLKPEADMIKVPAALIRELSLAGGDRKPDEDLFNRDDRINEALGITDYEKATIQTAWRNVRQRIRDAEVASMTSEEIDEWSVRITVPDLSQPLQQLGGEFRASIGRALGSDRSEAFLAAKQVDRVFAPSGGVQTYTVTTEEIGDGRWRYRFTNDGPDGRHVWVGETIPEQIRHLTEAARVHSSLGK